MDYFTHIIFFVRCFFFRKNIFKNAERQKASGTIETIGRGNHCEVFNFPNDNFFFFYNNKVP